VSWEYENTAGVGTMRCFFFQEAVILFVVEDVTFNIGDQKALELEVKRHSPGARVVRRNIAEIARTGFLTKDKRLILDNQEVAVIYWRCG